LAVIATFLGCFLIYTVPDFVVAQFNRQMPYWFYESEVISYIPAFKCPVILVAVPACCKRLIFPSIYYRLRKCLFCCSKRY